MAEKIKIDIAVLQSYLEQYKASFQQRLGQNGEIFKWRAIKHFQDNWDISASDFPAMLKAALAETSTLLAAGQFFPRNRIEELSNEDPETVRSMFRSLFDETRDVVTRVKEFEDSAAKLLERYPALKSVYQNPNSISTYLWLKYPDKYYIYLYSIIKDNAQKLCGLGMPSDKFDRMLFALELCDAICKELAKDTELVALLRNNLNLTKGYYPDDALKTLTIDVAFFISKNDIPTLSVEPTKVNPMPKNIILYGPPGTGKTYSSVQHAVAIIEEKPLGAIKAEDYAQVFARYLKYKEDGLIAFTTFHQSFGYEEFIEGIRPVTVFNGSAQNQRGIEYEIHDGIFKAFCDNAGTPIATSTSADTVKIPNRVFIIDEINRGNISKIFGELITLIEPSKRIGAPEEHRAILPYSGRNFGVPGNVYIIGTMNTADRSIALIDTALRRRFDFVEMVPDSRVLQDIVVEGIDIAELLDTMNRRITVLLDREHTIGHSYLLPLKNDPSLENLAGIFENKIMPLLQEYFYDDYQKIQLVLGDNRKDDDSVCFVVKNSDAVKLFGNADIDYPEFYEINREAFKRIEAYASLN